MSAGAGRRCKVGVRAAHGRCTAMTAQGPSAPAGVSAAPAQTSSLCAASSFRFAPSRKSADRLAAALALLCLLPAQASAEPFEQFGTAMKYGLPLAAAVCAADQNRLEDFAVRGVLQAAVVWGMKAVFDGAPISRRPSGEGKGFPSGHTAAAFFGASDLAGKCFDDKPWAGAAAYGAAGLTGWSRVHAGEHTPQQVWTGALIGISFGAASFGIGTEGVGFEWGMRF
ncbi:PAP2 superfamily protein [Paracoccus aminovorans]|uniref:PAP2 superfamily protein n=1 Tax=Paracoccus aminovorans TaxID=34004 RepID=A0A1I3CTJ6_9RHOB|nr:PAP2 superfamily protein [Paracoccus aminovorans]